MEGTELQVFDFNFSQVRLQIVDGEPWFLLLDLCRALNLQNPSMVAQRLQPKQRAKLSLGRQGDAIFVNESGMYRTVLRSDSPSAEPFQVWVTEDVIPAIRKTGSYTHPQAAPAFDISDPLVLAQKFIEAETERRALVTQVEVMTPKAEVYDALISADGTYAVGDAAKILGTGEIRLFQLLRERKALITGGEHHNLPYQSHLDRGYFKVKTSPRPAGEGQPQKVSHVTRVTPKGLAWMQKGMTQQNLQLDQPA